MVRALKLDKEVFVAAPPRRLSRARDLRPNLDLQGSEPLNQTSADSETSDVSSITEGVIRDLMRNHGFTRLVGSRGLRYR